jgi:hypothetical protein
LPPPEWLRNFEDLRYHTVWYTGDVTVTVLRYRLYVAGQQFSREKFYGITNAANITAHAFSANTVASCQCYLPQYCHLNAQNQSAEPGRNAVQTGNQLLLQQELQSERSGTQSILLGR